MKWLLACASFLALSSPAHAEESADYFLAKTKTDDGALTTFGLNAIGIGFSWTNSVLENRGQSKLFCVPQKLSITPEQNVQILRQFVEKNPKVGHLPAGLVLLTALQDTFPCSPGK